jgi:hypothetical protein
MTIRRRARSLNLLVNVLTAAKAIASYRRRTTAWKIALARGLYWTARPTAPGSWIRQNQLGTGSWSLAWTVSFVSQRSAGPAEISREGVRYGGGSRAGIGRRRAGAGRFPSRSSSQGRLTAPGFEKLLSLADRGVVEFLDMEFIAKDADGKSKKVDVWEFAVPDGVDLTAWAGASSRLLEDSDVGEISAAMQPGSVAVVVIYENWWVLGLVDAWRRDGARSIADGGLSAERHRRCPRRAPRGQHARETNEATCRAGRCICGAVLWWALHCMMWPIPSPAK